MSAIVRGTFDEDQLELVAGQDDPPEEGDELPALFRLYWDTWIEDQEPVGLPWFKRVPSYMEDEGFVAGCLAMFGPDCEIEGFEVPEPDPELEYA